jgi:glutathione S-transferase
MLMSDEITFYQNPFSRGRIARLMLEEIGAPYRTELLDFDAAEHKTAEYLAINPMGKIPAIVHKGQVVTETAAICAYLADAFPEAGLAPALDDPKRGGYYRWLFFGAGCVDAAILDKSSSRPGIERPGAIGYGSFETTIATLAAALEPGPYLLGDQYTAADVYVGSQIAWGMMISAIEPNPVFADYLGRIRERPASKRAAALDNELVAQLQAKGSGPS